VQISELYLDNPSVLQEFLRFIFPNEATAMVLACTHPCEKIPKQPPNYVHGGD
jgi:hypothetical protein